MIVANEAAIPIAYSYDAADRPILTIYPDGTTEQFTYDRLDLASYRDRLGHVWAYAHDANGNVTAITDPSGAQVLMTYSPNGDLLTMTDANSHTTTWTYDLEHRPITKQYADSSSETYTYETTTSRLKSRKDPLNQIKQYAYTTDNRISQISYSAAVHATPSASFAYDTYFPRLVSMTDGIGTTQYSYGALGQLGAMRLVQTTGPLSSSTMTYGYDELGRMTTRTVAGSGVETFQFDAIGRLATHISDLGTFNLSYLGQTGQITQRALTGTTLKTNWSYLPNAGDRRLSEIDNTGLSASNYSNFAMTSNLNTQVTSITESSDAATAYPVAASQSASFNNLNQVTALSGTSYTYDAAGNLTSDGARTYTWDAENRLIGIGYPALPGKATSFSYDGLGRRLIIASTPAGGGSAVTTSYLWCGDALCQARNSANAPVREYLAEGEYVPGGTPVSYYYGIDKIGSIRRVFASSGAAPAYAYDPYGNPLQATPGGRPAWLSLAARPGQSSRPRKVALFARVSQDLLRKRK